MKKNIQILMALALVISSLYFMAVAEGSSNEPCNIAVMDFENETDSAKNQSLARVLTDKITAHLVKYGTVQILERPKVQKIIEEQALSLSGLIDTEHVSEVGKMLAARFMVIGTLARLPDQWVINVRLLEVRSGRVVTADIFKSASKSDLFKHAEIAAINILARLDAERNKNQKTALIFLVHPKNGQKQYLSDKQIKRLINVLHKKSDHYGALLEKISKVEDGYVEMIFRGLSEPLKLVEVLISDDILEFRLVRHILDSLPSSQPDNMHFIKYKQPHGGNIVFYEVGHTPELTSLHIKNASVALDAITNIPYIKVEFDSIGTVRFAEITRNNIGKLLAVVQNGKVLMAPVIRDEVKNGKTQITGQFNFDEAFQFVVNIKSGNLPASLSLSEIKIR